MKKIVIACFGVMLLQVASATALDASLIQTSGEPSVGSGKFYGYRTVTDGPGDDAFAKAKALADEKHLPLVVIWSNENCAHCDAFATDCNRKKSSVTAWLKGVRAVVVYFKSDSGDDPPARADTPKASSDAYYFAYDSCKARPAWPLIGIYYKKVDGTEATWGTPNGEDTNSKTFAYLQTKVAAFLEANHISDYPGGMFTVSGTACDRYEMEAATRHADVEMVRSAEDAQFVATNTLYAFWPGENGPYLTTNVDWSVGETGRWVRVSLAHGAFPGAGAEIVLKLSDEYGNVVAEQAVACVEPEVSASNPKWIGEGFGFGEWTMDLAAATQLVAQTEGPAYTVVSMQGSKWCPDCANVERNFLDVTNAVGENAFVEWAKSRKVALVSIDIPNFTDMEGGFSTPTLLSRKAAYSTLARKGEFPQSGAQESLLVAQLRSGVGYLTRKGVDETTAAQCLGRNHFLAKTNTDLGGFHRPEDGNPRRTGVPIFVLLRKDGTVAARLTRMAAVSPMAADRANFDNYIRRFEEMIAVAATSGEHADASEIANNYPDAGAAVVTAGGMAAGELSHADIQDTFRVDGVGGGSHLRAEVSGAEAVEVMVSVVKTNALGVMETLVSQKGVLDDSVAVVADLQEDGDYFVQVKAADVTDGAFALESPRDMHFHRYEVRADVLLMPTDRTATTRAAAGSRRLVMRVTEGARYRIAGIETPSVDKLVAIATPPFGRAGKIYEALVNEDVELTVTAEGGEAEFQRWCPGRLSFAVDGERVIEYAGTGTVSVVRTDGGSNAETVTVRCVSHEAAAEGRYVWQDQKLVWEDGEQGAKEVGFTLLGNEVYEQDATFTLALEHDSDSPVALVSPLTNVVTICDTDAPCLEKSSYSVLAVRSFSSSLVFPVINIREGGRITVKRASGSAALPSGMSVKYDSVSGQVVLTGVPTKAGTYTFEIVVSECRRKGVTTGFATTITVTVAEPADTNEYAAKARPSQKLAFCETDGFGQDRLVGLLDVAVTSAGRISAKYAGTESKTVSFSGSWQTFDKGGRACATLSGKDGSALSLALDRSGTLRAALDSLQYGNLAAVADWPETGVFDAYRGYYTAVLATNGVQMTNLAQGSAYLTLTMTSASCVRSGTVRYAGVLPDGAAVSGSVVMRNLTGSAAELPVFYRSARNVLGAVVSLGANGASNWAADDANLREVVVPLAGTAPYVWHRDQNPIFDYVTDCEVAGVWYQPGIAPETLYDIFYGKYGSDAPFVLRIGGEDRGVVRVKGTRLTLDRTTGLSFSFVPRTGVFSGSATLTIKGRRMSGQYRGAVIPGWINSCECGYTAPERPFGGGTFYYRDRVEGKACTLSLPVDLDIVKPQ